MKRAMHALIALGLLAGCADGDAPTAAKEATRPPGPATPYRVADWPLPATMASLVPTCWRHSAMALS